MVPVLDKDLNPLMPCKERRARTMMEKGRAKPYWKDGIFCIILQNEPSARNYQDIVVGIDPGSKREGFTIATEKRVVMNITSDAITYVSKRVEVRKSIRNARRKRKTPFRKCRIYRKNYCSNYKLTPSIKSRWDAKYRVVYRMKNLIPITIVSIEDISAKTIKNSKKWNAMFSPIEIGKNYFYDKINNIGLSLKKWEGFETCKWRVNAGYKKTSKKLQDRWDAHNVDSHCLCEMAFENKIKPIFIFLKLVFYYPIRRMLFCQQTLKKGRRKRYGGTMSVGFKKNTLVRHKINGLSVIGGNYRNNKVSLHNIHTHKRITRDAKKEDITIVSYNLKWHIVLIT